MVEYNKGDIVNYRGDKKAKIIGVSEKGGNTKYKLRLYDQFGTIVTNINPKEISRRTWKFYIRGRILSVKILSFIIYVT